VQEAIKVLACWKEKFGHGDSYKIWWAFLMFTLNMKVIVRLEMDRVQLDYA
jgi:hypothetical protein